MFDSAASSADRFAWTSERTAIRALVVRSFTRRAIGGRLHGVGLRRVGSRLRDRVSTRFHTRGICCSTRRLLEFLLWNPEAFGNHGVAFEAHDAFRCIVAHNGAKLES